MSRQEASSSSSSPTLSYDGKFYTRGPNLFTAVQEFFKDEPNPPIYAPSLLYEEQLLEVDNSFEFWKFPSDWLTSGVRATHEGNIESALDNTKITSRAEALCKRMFFNNWSYYAQILLTDFATVTEKVDDSIVDVPDGTSAGKAMTTVIVQEELVLISPKTIVWILAAIAIMSHFSKCAVPVIVPPYAQGKVPFDISEHFGGLVDRATGTLKSGKFEPSYFQMILLTAGKLFQTVSPHIEQPNVLFVDARWKYADVISERIRNRVHAYVSVDGDFYTAIDYETFAGSMMPILESAIKTARSLNDVYM